MKFLLKYFWRKFQSDYLNQWLDRYRKTICWLWDHRWKDDEASFGFGSHCIKYATGNSKCVRCGETQKKDMKKTNDV
jgi:hypothetical protein